MPPTGSEPIRSSSTPAPRDVAQAAVKTVAGPLYGRLAAKGMAWSMLQSVFGLSVTLLVFVVTSRILERSDFGTVAFAATLVTFGLAFAPLAYSEAVVQIRSIEDRDLDSLFSASIILGLLLYGFCCFMAFALQDRIGNSQIGLLTAIIGLRILFESACVVPIGVLQREMSFRALALRQFAGSVVGNLLCLFLALAGFGFWALVANSVAAAAMSSMIVIASSPWRPRSVGSPQRLIRFVRYGSFAMGSRAMVILRPDQFLIGLFQPMGQLGAFYLAHRIIELCSQVCYTGLSPVSHSMLSRFQGDAYRLRQGYLTALFVAASLTFPLFGGLIYLAPTALETVFGNKWDSAVPLLRALAVTGLLGGIGAIQGALITSQGSPGEWFALRAATLAARVIGLLIVMPFWGLEPGVWAYVLAGSAVFPVATMRSLRFAGVSVCDFFYNLASSILATLVMVGGLWFLDRLFAAGTVPLSVYVLFAVALFGAVFSLVSYSRIKTLVLMLRTT